MNNHNILTYFFKKINKKALGFKKDNKWYWLSNEHIIKNVNAAKNVLSNLSITKGDRVAYQGKNSPEWLYWNMAVQSKGAIWTPMLDNQSREYGQYIVNNCNPKITITNDIDYINTINIRNYINSDNSVNGKTINIENTDKDDISTLIYTSGTTCNPKGVMLTHNNLISNIKSFESRFSDITHKTTSLSILPWTHNYSLTTDLYYNLYKNNSIVLSSDKTTFIQECGEISPNILYASSQILDLIKSKFDKYNVPLFKHVIPQLLRNILGNNIIHIFIIDTTLTDSTKFFFINNGIKICEGYGIAEISSIISINHHIYPRINHSMGKILDDILVDIVDNEIQVSGPNIMEGYWNEPIQPSEVLINRNNKLWYKTGDSGYIKNDFLYYTGRINKK